MILRDLETQKLDYIKTPYYKLMELGLFNLNGEEITDDDLKLVQRNTLKFFEGKGNSGFLGRDLKDTISRVTHQGAKLLQIGGGGKNHPNPNYNVIPGRGSHYDEGPRRSEALRELGYEMWNLEIEEKVASEYVTEDNFVHGSWLDIEKHFPETQFDCIFMETMDPFMIKAEIAERKDFSERELISKTLSHLSDNGSLIVFGAIGNNYRLDETAAREIISMNCDISYFDIFRGTPTQIMAKGVYNI